MYNSFGVIQNNFQKRLTVKHRVHVLLPQILRCWFLLVSFQVLGKVWTAKTECTVYLVRTARHTMILRSKRRHEILALHYGSVAHFLSRSQQVQNKVTTRFNKLIYILFKDVQCTFCLIQGFRVSRNFYLHMYRSQTAMMSEDAGRAAEPCTAALWMLRT